MIASVTVCTYDPSTVMVPVVCHRGTLCMHGIGKFNEALQKKLRLSVPWPCVCITAKNTAHFVTPNWIHSYTLRDM